MKRHSLPQNITYDVDVVVRQVDGMEDEEKDG